MTPLTPAAVQKIEALFAPESREAAGRMIAERCGADLPLSTHMGPHPSGLRSLGRTARTPMPIVDVEIITSESLDGSLAARIADMAAQVFGGPPASTWVRVRPLPQEHYAENGIASPAGWRAVFVTVLKAQRPSGSALEAEVRALTEGIARVCGRPVENVHILYEPDAQGRIAFGGRLKT